MKDVLVKIVGAHGYGEDEDPIEFMSEGKMGKYEDGIFIEYEESELAGMPGCVTRVEITGPVISVVRKDKAGGILGTLTFEKGNRHEGEIETPMGPIKVEILADNVSNNVTYENKGGIVVDYTVSLQGIGESRSSLNMTIL